MKTRNAIRKVRWTPNVLSVLAIAWLTILLQPCAMALGGSSDQPCPPDSVQHHTPMAEMQADHSQKNMPCMMIADECGTLDKVNIETRQPISKIKDAPSDLPVFASLSNTISTRNFHQQLTQFAGHRNARLSSTDTEFNKLYCVYLI